MLDSGSAFGDETLTIWKSTLENPESGGRKYPAAHLSENMAILIFFDSGHFEVVSRPPKVEYEYWRHPYILQWDLFFLLTKKSERNSRNIFTDFFSEKKSLF